MFIARGSGHAVVARPGAVVLVPLPNVTLERRLGVELELVDVDVLPERLPQRFDQPRMMRQQAKHLVVFVRREGGARRAALLAPDFLAMLAENLVGAAAHQGDLFFGEAIGKEAVALLVELAQLLGGQIHAGLQGRRRGRGRTLPRFPWCGAPILHF
jgi:hypothetical protein